ncbi:MAG: P-type conjugative transfer protein TrbJ [Gallionella sp.]|nr:P-type conjugative transfer protein TrbJ [Gallionella sp.]
MSPGIRILLLSTVVLSAAAPSALAGSVAGNGGATEITQLMNNTQLMASFGEQAQQTIHQFNQYQTMLRNLQKLNPSGLSQESVQKLWKDQSMNDTFRSLYGVVVGGQQQAYSLRTADQQFKIIHPGHGNYSNGFDYQNAYKNWSDTSRQAVTGSLRMASVQADDLQTEGDMVQALADASSTADGQLQATQAGNQIGVAMVSQMQKLRQLQMAQMQAQNTTALADQGRKDGAEELLRRAYQGTRTSVPTYQQIIEERGKQQ